jgi:hypothetical protein
VKIGHLPQHIGEYVEHNMRSERSLNLRSAGHTEMDPGKGTLIPKMRDLLHPAHVYTADIGPHSQEVPIACRENRRNHVEDHHVRRLSPDMGGGIHQDRYMTTVEWRKGLLRRRRWAHIALHLSYGTQDPKTGEPRTGRIVNAYVDAVKRVEAEIARLRADGCEVVVGGDWNYRLRPGATPWKYSPQAVAERHNMRIVSNGLDHVMWTKGFRRVRPVKVYPAHTAFNKSDHPWIVVSLVFRLRGSK